MSTENRTDSDAGSSATSTPKVLAGKRVWIVTDGSAESDGWLDAVRDGLKDRGVASVDVMGVTGAIGHTARGLLESGAERIARTMRLARRGGSDSDAIDAFRESQPDIVLIDHPAMSKALDVARNASGADPLHIGLIGNYGQSAEWAGARVDAYIAPEPMQLHNLRRPGMAEAALVTAGPPIPTSFAQPLDRDALRKDFGFNDDDLVVLVDVSTMLDSDIDQLVLQLSVLNCKFVTLFTYGTNQGSADVLRQAAAAHGLSAQMFGKRPDLAEYFAIPDLVITGHNNSALPLYFALHRPVVALHKSAQDSVPARAGALVVVSEAVDVAAIIQEVAANGVPQGHIDGARQLGRPEGTEEVLSAIARLWDGRADLRVAPLQQPPPASSQGPSRFESIGQEGPAPDLLPMSRAVAKEQLAKLILEERKIESQLTKLARERDKWMGREQLAADAGDAELLESARTQVSTFMDQVSSLNGRLTAIQSQKDSVRARASGAPSVPASHAGTSTMETERRFRDLEMKRDLNRLRDKADGQ